MGRTALLVIAIACLAAAPVPAQDSPFVPPEVFRLLSGEISGDLSYEHIRRLTLYHSPSGASQGFRDKMRWIAAKAEEIGFEDVRIIDDLPYRGPGWTARSAELFIVSPEYRRLASFDETAVSLADHSRSGEWQGDLVDVGAGAAEADYEGKEVAGKIVLASGSPAAVAAQAVFKRRALGIVYYNTGRGIDHPDQVAWIRLNPRPPEGRENTFAFSLPYRAGMELKQRLARGERISLDARVSAEIEENPTQWIVEGWIRGRRRDQAIVLTAHAQEEQYSANDDNSGCANLLEIGRALGKLMREGRLPRPERDIRFWWVNEISSEYAYFARHPEERGRILLDLNQDMVGAKQSLGSRVQHITRTPHSRPSYLNDVVESVAGIVVRGNNGYLAAGQAGTPQPFSKPILSRTGTRERFAAEMVPYFANTDHMVFVDSIIGIPAVTLTNWPDPYIHSSDDDLWQIDPTQLQRNAFIVAATALYFAGLRAADAPALAVQVHAGALRRLAADFARSTEILGLAAADARAAAYLDGVNLIEQAAIREAGAIDSLRVFDPGLPLEPFLKSVADAAASFRAALGANYLALTGEDRLPAVRLSEEESAMAGKVPEVAAGVAEYLERRNRARGAGKGLHPLMRFETYNFVDGRRSYLDIYRAVRAEAQSAGAWYYGAVEPSQVAEALDAGVTAGFLRLKPGTNGPDSR